MTKVQVCLKKVGGIQHKAKPFETGKAWSSQYPLTSFAFWRWKNKRNGKVTNVYECRTIYLLQEHLMFLSFGVGRAI